MKILFLDESGDHDLLKIGKEYPVFVLGGVVIDKVEHDQRLVPGIVAFKRKMLGSDDIILHFRDYARSLGVFHNMRSAEFRERFYCELEVVLNDVEFFLMVCLIDKEAHKKRYQLRAMDPYLLSLEVLIERFVLYLNEVNDRGLIIAESRGAQLDNEINLAFL